MRLNQYIALNTNLSRRAADKAISLKRVHVNNKVASLGQQIADNDIVMLDSKVIVKINNKFDYKLIMLNKPVGYICSKNGQGSKTIYDLLPIEYRKLNNIGRLDKDSSGLLLLTNDGNLHNKLMHPSFNKLKEYIVTLDKPLKIDDINKINKGIKLPDGLSKLNIKSLINNNYLIRMTEGRNRQIRRTFKHIGYSVITLKRIKLANYELGSLAEGKYKELSSDSSGNSTTSLT